MNSLVLGHRGRRGPFAEYLIIGLSFDKNAVIKKIYIILDMLQNNNIFNKFCF